MASIVWLLYLADVVGGVSTLLCAAAGTTLTICGAYAFIATIANSDSFNDDKLPVISAIRGYVIASLIALAVACFIPSKTTIYAAAAVTAGEKALNTPTGDKALRALNAWLDRQIADEPKAK